MGLAFYSVWLSYFCCEGVEITSLANILMSMVLLKHERSSCEPPQDSGGLEYLSEFRTGEPF